MGDQQLQGEILAMFNGSEYLCDEEISRATGSALSSANITQCMAVLSAAGCDIARVVPDWDESDIPAEYWQCRHIPEMLQPLAAASQHEKYLAQFALDE